MSYKVTTEVKELSAQDFVELLGFRDAKEKEEGVRYVRADGSKGKFVLDRNRDNRPLKSAIAERYADQMFHGTFAGQWNHPSETCNGEPIILDAVGQVTSGAHRGVGLILAQAKRDLLAHLGMEELIEEFSIPEKITLPTVVVRGIDPAAADTVDLAAPRTMGDVLYRRHQVNGKDLPATTKAMLNRELATALRLVWLRLRGEVVSGGGKFTFPDALKFLERHPLLVDAINHIHAENENSRISGLVSIGYAAAMMYLFGFAETEREGYEDDSTDMKKKPKLWDTAEKFWTLFGQMSARTLKKEDNEAVHAIVDVLDKNKKAEGSKKFSRDAICSLLVRAWEGFHGEGAKTSGGLTKSLHKKVGDKEVLTIDRLGGLDLDYDLLVEKGWARPVEQKLERFRVGGWKVGDTTWVNQPGVDPWFGTIIAFGMDGKDCAIEVGEEDADAEGERKFGALTEWLCSHKPKRKVVKEDGEAAEGDEGEAEENSKEKVEPVKVASKKKLPPKKSAKKVPLASTKA